MSELSSGPQNEGDASMENLSNLPDYILVDIISRLEMKEAIRTSVLSKRWEYLWASKSDLLFEEEKTDNMINFMNIVDRAFQFRDSSSVNNFTLYCEDGCDDSHIETWIYEAVHRNARTINVTLEPDEVFIVLPYSIFTSATLTSLRLEMLCDLNVPTSVCLSALKCLVLDRVIFSVDNSIEKLLSGCPVLEKLILSDCRWMELPYLSISAPMLQTLEIVETESVFIDETDIDGYVEGCQVEIFGTSNFKYFSYKGSLENDYCIYNSPSIECARMLINCDVRRRRKAAFKAYKLLKGLANAEKLILCHLTYTLEAVFTAEEFLPLCPMFGSLVYLKLRFPGVNLDSQYLLKLLRCSHYLQTIEFTEGISLSSDFEQDDELLNPVPLCLLNKVKRILIGEFWGYKKEFIAVKLLLKNALVLDNMTIFCAEKTGGLRTKVTELLKESPKGSESCEIIVNSFQLPCYQDNHFEV